MLPDPSSLEIHSSEPSPGLTDSVPPPQMADPGQSGPVRDQPQSPDSGAMGRAVKIAVATSTCLALEFVVLRDAVAGRYLGKAILALIIGAILAGFRIAKHRQQALPVLALSYLAAQAIAFFCTALAAVLLISFGTFQLFRPLFDGSMR